MGFVGQVYRDRGNINFVEITWMGLESEIPQVFISYAWGSEEHEAFVIRLAEDLQQNGIHVHLDKWDLSEGQDKYVFMERMVNDEKVSKVLMLCDRKYHDKANERRGGVGVETQIISAELYAQVDQTKFIPLIVERDDEGRELLPAFLKSRIYLDFSSEDLREASFESLLRAIYNKPLHKRPEIGARPRFLDEELNQPATPWRSAKRLAEAAFKLGRSHAPSLLDDTTERLCDWLISFSFKPASSQVEGDDQVIAAINGTLGARNELIDLVGVVVTHTPDEVHLGEMLHNILERLLRISAPAPDSVERFTFEDINFLTQESLIYVVAILLAKRRFVALRHVLHTRYVIPYWRRHSGNAGAYGVGAFMCSHEVLFRWNSRQNSRWLSPQGHLIKERAKRRDVSWDRIREADFFVFFTQFLARDYWETPTGPYSTISDHEAFETFVRAESMAFYSKLSPIWWDKTPAQVRELVATADRRNTPSWDYRILPLEHLARAAKLGSRA